MTVRLSWFASEHQSLFKIHLSDSLCALCSRMFPLNVIPMWEIATSYRRPAGTKYHFFITTIWHIDKKASSPQPMTIAFNHNHHNSTKSAFSNHITLLNWPIGGSIVFLYQCRASVKQKCINIRSTSNILILVGCCSSNTHSHLSLVIGQKRKRIRFFRF